MNPIARKIKQNAESAWTNSIHHFTQIRQSCTVLSTSPQNFRVSTNAENHIVNLSVGPVVLNVTERPRHSAANLYIVMEGWISFDNNDVKNPPFQTKNFGTRVAYFRRKKNRFEHTFGAHYDMDEFDYRHPVFHAQMRPYASAVEHVRNLFSHDFEIEDCMNQILRNVRIPTAQMDVFSVLIQICADHLIEQHPAPETTLAFENLKSTASFFIGAGNTIEYLNSLPASSCYRSRHWYNK